MWKKVGRPELSGSVPRGYGGQTSYHYGAVGHWSAGLGELQGVKFPLHSGQVASTE